MTEHGSAYQSAQDQGQPLRSTASVYPATVPWPAVLIFTVTAMGLAWLVMLPVWLSGDGLASPFFSLLAAVMMFTPTVATLIVVFLLKRPPSIPRLLGLAPFRPAGRTIGFLAIAWLGFPLLSFLALLLGQAMGIVRLDFTFESFGQNLGPAASSIPEDALPALGIVQLVAILLNSFFASITAFGEELGWRGWLLPNLRALGTFPALILSGVIWGVWHAPVILLGYNYARPDLLGLLLMVGWCVLLGIVIGWLRLRSASVWPAVLAHGAVNAAAGSVIVVLAASDQSEDSVVFGSVLGWPGWILLAAVIIALLVLGQFRKQPEPLPARAKSDQSAQGNATLGPAGASPAGTNRQEQ